MTGINAPYGELRRLIMRIRIRIYLIPNLDNLSKDENQPAIYLEVYGVDLIPERQMGAPNALCNHLPPETTSNIERRAERKVAL